jgi:hypothetical protein
MVLSAGGALFDEVWLPQGQRYKIVLESAPPFGFVHGVVLRTWDNITGINDTSVGTTWVQGPTPTLMSGTQFSMVGDQTLNFFPGNRVWAVVGSINLFGTISASVYSGGITTVTVQWDSGSLSVGLSAVYYPSASVSSIPSPRAILAPSYGGGWPEIIGSSWIPYGFNQAWGGNFTPLPDGQWGEACLANLEDNSNLQNIADVAANTMVAQGISIGKSIQVAAVWVRLKKVGNPLNSLQCAIYYDDGTGKPSAAVAGGTGTPVSGRAITAGGVQWVRFAFPTPPSVGTGAFINTYVVLSSSGAVDAGNYWQWLGHSVKVWPYGKMYTFLAVWTALATVAGVVLVEPTPSFYTLQQGGFFGDAQLVFRASTFSPFNENMALLRPLKGLVKGSHFSLAMTLANLSLSSPVLDLIWGLDHNRVLLQVDGTGNLVCNVWSDQSSATKAGTLTTVTAGVCTAAGPHVVGLHIRAVGDGADRVDVYLDGATTSATGLTLTFDPLWVEKGTAWVGGALGIPVWASKLTMAALPSATSPFWTYAGTATETDVFTIVQDGRGVNKLVQNGAAYDTTLTGYYGFGGAGSLSNANGWTVAKKLSVGSGTAPQNMGCSVYVSDGAAAAYTWQNSGFMELADGVATAYGRVFQSSRIEPKTTQDNSENEVVFCGKAGRLGLFVNGYPVVDDSTLLKSHVAAAAVQFGDLDTIAGNNIHAVYDTVATDTVSDCFPTFNDGMTLYELGFWDDMQAPFAALWGDGVPQSMRKGSALVPATPRTEVKRVLTTASLSSGQTYYLANIRGFFYGGKVQAQSEVVVQAGGSVPTQVQSRLQVDGDLLNTSAAYSGIGTANYYTSLVSSFAGRLDYGLHYVQVQAVIGAQNVTLQTGNLSVSY